MHTHPHYPDLHHRHGHGAPALREHAPDGADSGAPDSLRRACAWSTCRGALDGHLIERATQPPCECDGVVVRPEVHEEEARLFVEHVAVEGGDFNAALLEGTDDVIHLGGAHHEVARDRRLSSSGRMEVDLGGDAHGRWNLVPTLADRLAPRDADLVNSAAHLSGDAK